MEGDPMAGRNLLPHYAPTGGYEEDEYIMDYADCYRDFPVNDTTMLKTPDEGPYGYMTRKNSGKSRDSKYGLGKSRESTANSPSSYDWEKEARDKARARREYRHRRSKSGQWDPPGNRSLIYAPIPASIFSPTPKRGVLTQSAPDLMELLNVQSTNSSVAASPVENNYTYAPPLPPPRPNQTTPRVSHRSCTLGALPSQRKAGQTPLPPPMGRTNSKNKVRC